MIGILTPPAKGDAVPAGTKGAPPTGGSTAFAALFSAIGDGAVPTAGVPMIPPAGVVPMPAAIDPSTLVTGTPSTLDDVMPPTLDAVTPPVLDAVPPTTPELDAVTPTAPALDAVTPPTDAPVTDAALAGAVAVTVTSEADPVSAEDTCAPQLPVKPVTLQQEPVDTDEPPVKLPTLPTDFVAQKAPKSQAGAPQDDAEDAADETTGDTGEQPAPVVAAPLPLPVAAVPVPVQAAAVAASPVVSEPQGPRKPAAKAASTDKVEVAAPKAELSVPVTGGDHQETSDRGSAISFANLIPSHTATADQPQPSAPIAASLPAAVAQPQMQQPVPTISAQQSVALDDLMVAGAGDSAWLDRVASDISTLAKGESRQAHMKLNPESLGEMSIRLDMDGTRTRVHFTVDTPQVQSMIADNAPRLTSLVQANGLKLDGATVDLNQQRSGGQSDRAPQQQRPETASHFTSATRETARMIERTRIATRTERFA